MRFACRIKKTQEYRHAHNMQYLVLSKATVVTRTLPTVNFTLYFLSCSLNYRLRNREGFSDLRLSFSMEVLEELSNTSWDTAVSTTVEVLDGRTWNTGRVPQKAVNFLTWWAATFLKMCSLWCFQLSKRNKRHWNINCDTAGWHWNTRNHFFDA